MKIATLLFTYNRSYHTEQVISALKRNIVLPQKLFVFQDGLRHDRDKLEWKKVNNLIHSIDWCDREIIVSEYNKGLAESIVSGINYVFKDYDAVIVLEDDCVPTANFIYFMQQCFEKYRENKKVYSISGYSYPLILEKKEYDVYGCGRISSWGWGTWKDRWGIYEKDYELAKKMKQDKTTSENLAMWGRGLEEMLVGNVKGSCDSWAVFWALNVISKEGICINPYESLIRNIGMDGSGVHCGVTDRFEVKSMNEQKKEFAFPDSIGFLDETKEAFAALYGSYTAINKKEDWKEKVLVYGVGNFYLQNEKVINEKYYVEEFIDQKKLGWFAGKKIIRLDELKKYTYDKILVMVQDIQECIKIVAELIEQDVNHEQILLGHNFFGNYSNYINEISVLPDGNWAITVGSISRTISTKHEFDNFLATYSNGDSIS